MIFTLLLLHKKTVTPGKVYQPPGGGWNECVCRYIYLPESRGSCRNTQKTGSEIMNYKDGRVLLLYVKIT